VVGLNAGALVARLLNAGDLLKSNTAETRRLREQFADRAISVGSMTPALRWITGIALAAVVAGAVLVGLRGTSLPTVPLGAGGDRSTMPALSFWATIVLVSLAWSYLLGGVLHTYRPARLAAPAIFGFGVYEMLNIGLPVETWRMAPAFAFAAAIGVVSLLALRTDQEPLRLPMLSVLFVLALGFYLSFWWRLRPLGDQRYYSLAVYHQLVQLSFALIPLLLVTGVDFAEWADAVAGRASELARSVLPVAAAAAAAGPLAYLLVAESTNDLGHRVGMAAVFLTIAALVFAQARRSHVHVPYLAVFGCALALMGIVLGVVYSTSGPTSSPAARKTLRSKAPRFQIAYPASWQEKELPTTSTIRAFLFSSAPEAAQFYVLYFPAAIARTVSDPRAAIFKGTVTASSHDGPWLRERFREANGNLGVSWRRSIGGAEWLLAGVAARSTFPLLGQSFDEAQASWTQQLTAPPPTAAPPRYTSTDRVLEYAGLAWFALAVAAAALLACIPRRTVVVWAGSALSFVAVAGFYFGLAELPTIAYTLFGASSREAWPQLTLRGLEELAGILTLVALLTRTGRRVAGELVGLNLGLFAVYWIDRAISAGVNDAGRLSIVASLLVLFALLWDVVMSGKSITNRDDRGFPRHARILVYLGYVVGVAAALTFFSSIRTAGGVSEPLFESENFSDTGLLFLGTALVVTLFGLRVRSVLTAPEEAAD